MAARFLVVAFLAAGVAGAAGGAGAEGESGTYVVRGDPRACPSPLCGGYFVALANHARTRCADGLRRPRCYAAAAAGTHGRPVTIPDGALVSGSLGPGPDDLGELVVSAVFAPGGRRPAGGAFYRLVDTGVRCIRAPCPSVRASRLNERAATTVTGVDLTPLGDDALERRAVAALGTRNGVFVQGWVARDGRAGRELRATRVFLRAPPPRA